MVGFSASAILVTKYIAIPSRKNCQELFLTRQDLESLVPVERLLRAFTAEQGMKPVSVFEGAVVRMRRNGQMALYRVAGCRECGSHLEFLLEVPGCAQFIRTELTSNTNPFVSDDSWDSFGRAELEASYLPPLPLKKVAKQIWRIRAGKGWAREFEVAVCKRGAAGLYEDLFHPLEIARQVWKTEWAATMEPPGAPGGVPAVGNFTLQQLLVPAMHGSVMPHAAPAAAPDTASAPPVLPIPTPAVPSQGHPHWPPSLTSQPGLPVSQPLSLPMSQPTLTTSQPSLPSPQPSQSQSQPFLLTPQPSIPMSQPLLSTSQPSLPEFQLNHDRPAPRKGAAWEASQPHPAATDALPAHSSAAQLAPAQQGQQAASLAPLPMRPDPRLSAAKLPARHVKQDAVPRAELRDLVRGELHAGNGGLLPAEVPAEHAQHAADPGAKGAGEGLHAGDGGLLPAEIEPGAAGHGAAGCIATSAQQARQQGSRPGEGGKEVVPEEAAPCLGQPRRGTRAGRTRQLRAQQAQRPSKIPDDRAADAQATAPPKTPSKPATPSQPLLPASPEVPEKMLPQGGKGLCELKRKGAAGAASGGNQQVLSSFLLHSSGKGGESCVPGPQRAAATGGQQVQGKEAEANLVSDGAVQLFQTCMAAQLARSREGGGGGESVAVKLRALAGDMWREGGGWSAQREGQGVLSFKDVCREMQRRQVMSQPMSMEYASLSNGDPPEWHIVVHSGHSKERKGVMRDGQEEEGTRDGVAGRKRTMGDRGGPSIRPPPGAGPLTSPPKAPRRMELCRSYLKGRCKYGSTCWCLHATPSSASQRLAAEGGP